MPTKQIEVSELKGGIPMAKKQLSLRQKMQDNLKNSAENVQEKLSDVADNTTRYIEENPVKATLVAFGVGLIAGAILLKLVERK